MISNTHAAVTKTQQQINAALKNPQAKGMKGFLIWVKAAFPAKIANAVIAAAGQHAANQAASRAASPLGRMGAYMKAKSFGAYMKPPRLSGLGATRAPRLPAAMLKRINIGALGDDSSLALPDVSGAITTDLTPAIDATSTAPASASWASDLGSALQLAGQAYLTKTQMSDAQTLFDTNLTRAQQGLSPLPNNPTAYGLPAPTMNLGLSPATSSLVMWGGIAALVLGAGFLVVHGAKTAGK